MKTSDFFFNLPEELIAQFPTDTRGASRLMVVERDSGTITHRSVAEIPDLIEPGTLMVFNDSRVRKARLYGSPRSGGNPVEFLLVRRIDESSWTAVTARAKRQKAGKEYSFPGGVSGRITAEDGGAFRTVSFSPCIDDAYLDAFGHIPLPPYIRRADEVSDGTRYQTVYARATGSSAAPTAGLHFTGEILDGLRANGVETAFVTLHVGLGTFLPVRTEHIEDHVMHREEYSIDADAAEKIERAKADGRKILAVGTTSVRTLESAWEDGRVARSRGSTGIFIYPGYEFKAVDRMFTNFHTPESSLLMLVSAFAGKALIDTAYRTAIEERYRFYSYGDAMLIL